MNRDNDKGKVLIRRSLIMALIKFLLLMVIIVRLYYLQVYQADRYKTLADENRISTRLLVPPRGIIYDRNGVTIASNQQNFQALIVAEQAPNVQETLDAFKKIMPLSAAEEERIKKDLKRNRSFVPIKIRDNLSWEEVSKIQLNAPDLPGIVIDEGLTRYYPFGAAMAHILGYVSSVSDKDVKDDPLLEVPGFKIGKSGIEKYLEKDLRGESGNLKLEVNAYGRIMKEIERVDGIPGKDVQLTIDSRLQQKAFELFGEESGAAVLLDVLDTPVSPELLPPVDGVISQKTEDLVGPYELHDFFLYYMLRCGFPPAKVYRVAKKAFQGSYDNETILKWLKTFYRRFFGQQFKRSCLPDGPKVGSVALSPRGDLRMPSDASAQIWLKELEGLL